MENYTFLALQGPQGTPADLAQLAATVVGHRGRLSVLQIGPAPGLPYAIVAHPYGAPVIPDVWIGKRNEMAKLLVEQQTRTRNYLQQEGLSGEVGTICVEPTAFHDIVGLRAIFADISIVQNSVRKEQIAFDDIVYGLLFMAPGPVMLNVEKNVKALVPDNVFVAWNSSLQAIRAVRAAMPFLKAAKEVTIACFDADPSRDADGESPGADLATWLSHHNCRVTVHEYATGRDRVSDALLARARERTADLIVMGAYGRHRWNERFFGGTTETMIQQQEFPVLLAH